MDWKSEETLWMPVVSLVIGIICVIAFGDDSKWGSDTILGIASLSVIGLIFGVISINRQKIGKRIAITGIILSSLTLLASIGLPNE